MTDAATVLYALPHCYSIEQAPDDGLFILFCGGYFVCAKRTIDEVFIQYGKILDT